MQKMLLSDMFNFQKKPLQQKSNFFDRGSLQVYGHYLLHFFRGRCVKKIIFIVMIVVTINPELLIDRSKKARVTLKFAPV